MRSSRPTVTNRLLLVLNLALISASCLPAPATYRSNPQERSTFVILGDVRKPHPMEFWTSVNKPERRTLIKAIVAERPAFVAIHGDLVFHGSWEDQWAWFDRAFAPLRKAEIPILPALGNHEYDGDDEEALNNYFTRFPEIGRRHFYRRDLKGLAILVLDSNKKHLGKTEWDRQWRWYVAELKAADRNPQIRGVLVLLHHPPYTNSAKHSDHRPVKDDMVPPFVEARKTLALVASHVHTYERFQRQGKAFLNTGGGGAPRRKLLTGKKRRYPDDLYSGPEIRPFHYVSISIEDIGLVFTTRGLKKGDTTLHVMERFTLTWPAPRTPLLRTN